MKDATLRRSNAIALLFTLLLACTTLSTAHAQTSRLFRAPSLSDTSIAFRYADDIWIVPLAGGSARRLTSTGNVDGGPFFSPDGQTVAYDAIENGSPNVYTIRADGGVPKQITYHPGGNSVVGWTPDGRDLLFISMRHAFRTYFQMFRIHADGSGLPEQLPLPSAYDGSLSPDGAHLAYNPWLQWEADSWKRYHGGQTQPVWIVDLKTLDLVKVPRENSNDTYPTWLGDAVYFLSDRNGPVSLFKYDTGSKTVKQLVDNHGLDFKTLTGHGTTLAYEQFGTIHLYDTATGADHEVKITADGDLPALAPHLAKIDPHQILNAGHLPHGRARRFRGARRHLHRPRREG